MKNNNNIEIKVTQTTMTLPPEFRDPRYGVTITFPLEYWHWKERELKRKDNNKHA